MNDVSRRTALFGATMVGATLLGASTIRAAAPETVAWGFSFPSIEDGTLNLADYKGRVLLVTNTASFCGFTYQYEELEKMHAALGAAGLTVVGVPSEDFGQESNANGTIKDFCEATFGVQFPMTGLLHVRGAAADPFYKWVKVQKRWEPDWNFNKVLIGRDGRILGTYGSNDEPNGPVLRAAITAALKALPTA